MTAPLYTVAIDPQYGYVLLSGAFVWLVHQYLSFVHVGGARKKYKVPFGLNYEDAKESDKGLKLRSPFNFYQRGSHHLVENAATFYFLLLTSGVFSPVWTAIAGATWGIGRLAYAKGYVIDPKYRGIGELIYMPGELFMLVNVVLNAWRMIRGA